MRVVIVGAGEVGSSIAENLAANHDVVVVDRDAERVEQLTYAVDALAVEGDGASLETLREAGVEEADMLIASTDDDEVNLITCQTAKTLSDAFTVARVRSVDYFRTWQSAGGAFGADIVVCVTLQSARDIVRVIGVPSARDVDQFGDGLVQMAELEVPAESTLAGQTVREADRFDSLTFAALLRDGAIEIPRGDTTIEAGDLAVVIGSPESVQSLAAAVTPVGSGDAPDDIVIVGGSQVGYHTARLLADRGFTPSLVERDHDRARELAEDLPGVVVFEQDATDLEFLSREHVDEADLVIAALESDEKNLLVSILAKQLGAQRTVAVVEAAEYTEVFEEVGVDVTVNPREVTAEEITEFTHEGGAQKVAFLEGYRAEVLELEVTAGNTLTGRRLDEAAGDLPERVVVGAVIRDGELVVPRGDTTIEAGDSVVAFADTASADELTALL